MGPNIRKRAGTRAEIGDKELSMAGVNRSSFVEVKRLMIKNGPLAGKTVVLTPKGIFVEGMTPLQLQRALQEL